MTAEPVLSVLLVNYNGSRFLDACLQALAHQTLPRHRFEVIVVDNASTDDSWERLQAYPWVRAVRAPRNLGFAGGNNFALTFAHGELIVLLNTDTVAAPNWLAELLAALPASPSAASVASKLVFADDPRRLNSAGLEFYHDGRAGDRGLGQLDLGQFDQPSEVLGGCGAAVLYRRSMIDDVGLFDARLFMYAEDLDTAWRARLRGWTFHFAPRSVVRHVGGGSAGHESPLVLRQIARNRILTQVKNGNAFLACWTLLGAFLRVARDASRGWSRLRASASGLFSALLWLPMMLVERYRVRVSERRRPDSVLRPFTVKAPRR